MRDAGAAKETGDPGRGPAAAVADLRGARRVAAYGTAGEPPPELQELVDLAALLCGEPAVLTLTTRSGARVVAATEPGARACETAGGSHLHAPLTAPEEVTVGTLCVRTDPQHLDRGRVDSLSVLAARAVDVLELRLRGRELDAACAERDATRAELQRSHDRLAVFARQMSHDLRTSLTAISMCVELLGELPAVAGGGEARWMVERATGATKRMTALIEDLPAYARVNAALCRSEVNLGDVARDVLNGLDLADDGFVRVRVGALPVVRGDGAQLEAVMRTLLTTVTASAPLDVPLLVDVSARKTPHRWRVEVTDNRSTPAEGDAAPGGETSLATCSRVVQAHGGELGVDDSPTGGTLVWFELPAW